MKQRERKKIIEEERKQPLCCAVPEIRNCNLSTLPPSCQYVWHVSGMTSPERLQFGSLQEQLQDQEPDQN
jgi:hypothetical protein